MLLLQSAPHPWPPQIPSELVLHNFLPLCCSSSSSCLGPWNTQCQKLSDQDIRRRKVDLCSHKTHRKRVFSILNNVGRFVSANKIIELQPLIPDLEQQSCELCLCDDPALMCSTLGRWSSQKKWNRTCAQMLNICRFVSYSSRVPACIISHKFAFGHNTEKHTSRQL
jgi:hypothetical protein